MPLRIPTSFSWCSPGFLRLLVPRRVQSLHRRWRTGRRPRDVLHCVLLRVREAMPTEAEIQYVANLARVLNVPAQEVERHLSLKPFCDPARSTYLLDIAQI